MPIEVYAIFLLSAFAVISAVGSLITTDNFYAALYMALTLVTIAGIYALMNLQEIFILITFIFVGAIGIVTVSLAAVYKFRPSRQLSKLWLIPSALTVVILGYVLYTKVTYIALVGRINLSGLGLEYFLLISALVSLIVLLMLSILSISRGGISD